ncbi:helicase associated domain-containing protein, partial [Streptomyces sp. NPDC047725]|uniref:helicase associated domain-containing protein n=1 Tax=Streptomyces sp. NPDC047725 TaxID=3365487 RepID=UPI003715752A
MNYQAAKQFYEREGHLRVPRKHIERIIVGGHGNAAAHGRGEDQEERELRLGAWIGNQRSRAATLPRSAWSCCPRSGCGGRDLVPSCARRPQRQGNTQDPSSGS